MATRKEALDIAGREVTVTNPDKVYFPESGLTKLDLVRYYLSVGDGVLRGSGGRPMALKRYVTGVEGEAFYQKRAPENRPDWIDTVELRFPSGRSAKEIVLRDAAQLAWVVNLGCIDLNPHPVRASDLDHPDELRVDLDPVPGVDWAQIIRVALVAREVLADAGLTGWPKTSGSRGIHVYARIEPRWTFAEVRRAAVALMRALDEFVFLARGEQLSVRERDRVEGEPEVAGGSEPPVVQQRPRLVDQLGRAALVEPTLAEEQAVGGGQVIDAVTHEETFRNYVVPSAARDL